MVCVWNSGAAQAVHCGAAIGFFKTIFKIKYHHSKYQSQLVVVLNEVVVMCVAVRALFDLTP